MKKVFHSISKFLAIFIAFSILFSSCVSSTMIISYPPGAKVYLDGEAAGYTPYKMSDSKIVGSCTAVELRKEGYRTFNTDICRGQEPDIGAIIAGCFLLFPFLWTMKYKSSHKYELVPIEGE